MLKMDLSEMDRLRDQLFRSSADADEALHIVKGLISEMSCDDRFAAFDRYEAVADDLAYADSVLTLIKETLFGLGKIVSEAADTCREGESEKADIIGKDSFITERQRDG